MDRGGNDGEKSTITFDNAIIAAGSSVIDLPFNPNDDPRVIDWTGALELKDVPEEMLVLGGGIIGLEIGTVYGALGSNVSVVEFADQLVQQLKSLKVQSLIYQMLKQ